MINSEIFLTNPLKSNYKETLLTLICADITNCPVTVSGIIDITLTVVFIMLSMLVKNFSRWHFEMFSYFFSRKVGFDISCKLSHKETIFMKCQILFSVKNKKKYL